MEKHKCKLCSRGFSNGRALGGHMRSHMLNLPIPAKPEETPLPPVPPPQPPHEQLSETESASSPSSSSEEGGGGGGGGGDDDEKGLYYGLRENPKRSIRLVDPEFSLAVDAGSVVLQDRESETESSKNPTRRRSKRTRNFEIKFHLHDQQRVQEQVEPMKKLNFNKAESWAEPEPVSSISDTTTEEDVAFCLMMLSRDQWKKQEQEDEEEDPEDETERYLDDSEESEDQLKLSKTRTRGKYKCETCKKTFRSYQALGGHRASHKKIKVNPAPVYEPELEQVNVGTSSSMPEKKIHECPVCFRVFASGQALGGHKRTHVTGSAQPPASVRSSIKLGQALIDLNLPAPMDDDDISQIELSAVSDAEFVNPH
ncbi:hypothetical protein I3760_13G030700 [Carya illinoinensis]|uniref:C2H2-type domain-containing protein n=1 Tax=Carya illinoinensis TaxID=32201 RepID=A0A922AN18_CARIL|nr:zinc finger protein ZAT9-like [Carya illinoinensis]KAG2672235.1 hypothetical protein I3760_13G030700 [Carya illinoinensis]KAG2672236.1 hypothetical protein I3760_13G030700 [Carya illinoinensis]KAG6680244.1 hypothetical protein I3842_13G031800 [Carya illinoinensis]